MSGGGGGALVMDELDLNAVEAALVMLDGNLSAVALARRASCSEPAVELGTAVVDSFCSLEGAAKTGGEGATAATFPSPKPKKKRTRDPAEDVRRRARRREERQELQRQAERYEQQLKTLVARAVAEESTETIAQIDKDAEDGPAEDKVWESVAMEQSRHRAAGEKLNRQLKAKLAAHYDLSKRVGQMLFELASLYEKGKMPTVANGPLLQHISCGLSATTEHALVPCSYREQLVKQVRVMLRDAYLVTDEVFACFMTVVGSTNVNELFSTSRIRQDCEPGPCVELLSSTPMSCGLSETVEVIWNWLKWKRRSSILGFKYTCVVTDRGIEIQHDIQFSGPFDTETFHGVSAIEKHEEADRMVMVFTTKTAQSAGSVRFHDKGWILVSRSPVDPLHNSVVRAYYRVASDRPSVDVADGMQTGAPCDEALRGYVQRQLVKRMGTRLKELQRELLHATGRHDLEALIDI